MGQILSQDQARQLCLSPPPSNVQQTKKYIPLLLSPGLQSPFMQKVFQYQNYKKIQVTYKFLPDVYIHLQLSKQKAKQQAGHSLELGGQTVYGYKFKKNQKSEKIRSDKIYFRRKIFIPSNEPTAKSATREKLKNNLKNRRESRKKSVGKETQHKSNYQSQREDLLRKLAELKLLSKMQLGIKIGRTIDGNDGILTEHYIQFHSEIAVSQVSFADRESGQKDKICQNLQKKGFRVDRQKVDIAYSVFQKGYILRQTKKPLRQIDLSQNRSIKFIVRQFEEEINKAIVKLDGISNMMTAIQNYLAQRDVQKAMQKFEQNMSIMQEQDRLIYAQQMALILGKYNHYKSYERQVSSYISSSRSSSMAESRNLSVSRFNARSLKSDHPQDSTDNELLVRLSINQEGEHRLNGSPVSSPRSNHPLRFSDSQASNKQFINSFEQDFSLSDGNRLLQSNFMMWESAQERLKNSILDNDKNGINQALTCLKNLGILSHLEVEIYFGQLLMENAKTKHAKFIFQKLLHNKKGGYYQFLKSQIWSMLGFLAHSKGHDHEALPHYQKALTIRFKFRSYSRKTVLIFNNMAVLCYYLEKYEKCLLYLHRGMKLGQYCSDYELLMRSNYAMCLAEQGQLKQAKLQMYKTYRNVQPYSNNQIICKFYSNLGYFDLLDNLLDKAKVSLDLACQIQQKFLISNGYKPSVFLHNNYAMYHYKKGEWRKAVVHLQKIQNQINDLSGFKAIQIHFNFGKVYKQLYNYDSAIKHFSQSRYLLIKLDQKLVVKYREKIEQEIQRIECIRIDEVSQESSYANKLSRISKSIMSQKHIQSRIKN